MLKETNKLSAWVAVSKSGVAEQMCLPLWKVQGTNPGAGSAFSGQNNNVTNVGSNVCDAGFKDVEKINNCLLTVQSSGF